MVVITVASPDALHERLAIAAIEDGSAITEIVRTAARQWLDRQNRARAKGKKGIRE